MNTEKIKSLMEKFGISKTMAKLMLKHECDTPEIYRARRATLRKEAPKKAPKQTPTKPTPVQYKGKKK